MKIYVMGDHPALVIAAVNTINARGHTGIMSDLGVVDQSALADEVGARLKGYDYIVLLNSRPFEACMDLNRLANCRAVFCSDKGVIDRLHRSSTYFNVAIIDSYTNTKSSTADLVGALVSKHSIAVIEGAKQNFNAVAQKRQIQRRKARPRGGAQADAAAIVQRVSEQRMQEARDQKASYPEREPREIMQSAATYSTADEADAGGAEEAAIAQSNEDVSKKDVKKKGVFRALKDSLGI
ncbi:MAG: hypothetical protein M1474_02795 [Candidatus Marsarchaeota archaeon]|nr:hypothetical protein [Candidatus Marsarchaeota archaeon]